MQCSNCGKAMVPWQTSFKPFSYRCPGCKIIKVEVVK